MSDKAWRRPDQPRGEAGGEQTTTHRFDDWLKHELRALYGNVASDPLPPDIAELAAELERRLGRPRTGASRQDDADDD